VQQNHLAGARSPYLRQHASNPVDWYPWGEEALALARREDKPIFLSVGYAACHWCHVMEHESFEDEATAALLNEAFVCIKVDREERPDIDALYMQAVHLTSGRGGWPMTVLLTPEGEPFWAGTYLQRTQVQDLAKKVKALWASDASRLRQQAAVVTERIRELADGYDIVPDPDGSDEDRLRVLDNALAAQFDARRGGYGSRPKFPPHAELLYLLDGAGKEDGAERVAQARKTLEAMADGGIHDHVGGGFHRYSTDGDWFLPHFEKMLYDNALLAVAYARFYDVTRERRFADVARDILGWVRREMAVDGGGYASSLDADTEGEEGLTYTWTVKEIRAALPPRDASLVIQVHGVADAGNFRDEAAGKMSGRNILHRVRDLTDEESARLPGALAALLEARNARPQPGLDDKVITAWNGLLLSAFAEVGRVLEDDEARADGRRLATFLLEACRRKDGTLLRFPRGSGAEVPAFAEDHVHLIEGLLDLHQATGEVRWLDEAAALVDALLEHFEDPVDGGFFTTSTARHESLLARRKETFDSPIPSDNAVAARILVRLAALRGEKRTLDAAERTLAAWRPLMGNARAARGTVALYRALALALDARRQADRRALDGDARAVSDGIEADLFVERDEVRLGSRVAFALRVTVPAGWHVADTLTLVPQNPVALKDVHHPPGDLEGTFWIRGLLEMPTGVPLGPRRVPLRLRLQPCTRTACEAERDLVLHLPLRFAEANGPRRYPAIFTDANR